MGTHGPAEGKGPIVQGVLKATPGTWALTQEQQEGTEGLVSPGECHSAISFPCNSQVPEWRWK